MSDLLYCLPTDIATASATLSLTAGAAASGYPLTNLADGNPAKPFKATGTSCTIKATFSAPTTLRAISFGPHNLAGATVVLSNNGGMGSTPVTIPADREDGLSVNPFLAFDASTATEWTLAISGAAADVAIGEVQLIVQMRVMELLLGAYENEAHPSITHVTDYGVKLKYPLGISQRRVHGTVLLDSDVATFLTLMRTARGQNASFLLVMDSDVNDALLVDLMTDERSVTWITANSEIGQIDLDFLEVQRGLAL
jgi:hypothetical protein